MEAGAAGAGAAGAAAATTGAAPASGPAVTRSPVGLTEHWATVRTGTTVWVRVRSGVVLTFLLTVVGAIIAAVVAGVIVLLALAVRSAVPPQ